MNLAWYILAAVLWLIYEALVTKLNLSRIKDKLGRLESDAESEKDTRRRRNETIDARLRDLEKIR